MKRVCRHGADSVRVAAGGPKRPGPDESRCELGPGALKVSADMFGAR